MKKIILALLAIAFFNSAAPGRLLPAPSGDFAVREMHYAARLADDQERLSLRVELIRDLLTEISHWAGVAHRTDTAVRGQGPGPAGPRGRYAYGGRGRGLRPGRGRGGGRCGHGGHGSGRPPAPGRTAGVPAPTRR